MVTSFSMAKDLRGTVRCPAKWPEFQPLLIELWKKTLFIHSFIQQILTVYLDSHPYTYKPHSNNKKIRARDLPKKITPSKQTWDQFLIASLEFNTFQLNPPYQE